MSKVVLGDVCEKIGSGATPRGGSDVYLSQGEIALIRSQNVYNDGFKKDGLAYITEVHAEELSNVTVEPNDVLLNITGDSVARCCQVPDDVLPARVNQHVAIIRPQKDKLDARYLRYYLVDPIMQDYMLMLAGGGATRNALTKGMIESFEIPLPPLPEQRAIAGILGALDDKIELNRRMNRTLESMARAVFRQWFVESEDSKDWQEQTLQQHVEAEKGLSYKGEGLSKDGGTPMHNLNSVYEGGGYKYEGIKYYTGEYKERHILNAGDIIVTNTEQGFEYLLIGFPAIVPKHFGKTGIFTHHIFRVRPLPTSPLKTHYLYFLLMDPLVREQIIGCTNGTTVNMLSKDGLQTPKFKLPPSELIDKFENFASPIFDKMELLYEESRTLANLRDTLLPKLMRGEVRVSVL
jgi:type I restriction enzyme S subunit